MIIKINTLLFMITLLCVSCTSPQPTTLIKGTVIAVDPYRNDNVSVYDLFDAVEIIPLETHNEGLLNFPGGQPEGIGLYKENYYFMDERQAAILVFDASGKFVKKIAKKGEGPDEYFTLDCFTINRFTEHLEILSSNASSIYIYDLKGEALIKRIKLPDTLPIMHYFHHLTPDTYALYSRAMDEEVYFYSPQSDSIVKSEYTLPMWFSRTPFSGCSFGPFFVCNDTLRFKQCYDGVVFEISPETFEMNPLYTWDLGKHHFHYSVLPENESLKYYMSLFKTLSNEYAIHFVIHLENTRYYFTTFKFKNRFIYLILDKIKQKHYLFDKFTEGVDCIPMWIDEEYIYSVFSPGFTHLVVTPSMLDEKNRRILEGIGEEDNPVVIKYRFKK